MKLGCDVMKYYSISDEPMKIYGLSVADPINRQYWKLPMDIIEKMPQYEFLGKRGIGGRVRFCTNSKNIHVKFTLAQATPDVSVPLSCSAGADIYLGKGMDSTFLGYVSPKTYSTQEITVENTFSKTNNMEIVTINFPRNEHLLDMTIGLDDDAIVEKSPQYKYENPIVFYGSSITEGGCASRAGNTYNSILCRWLDSNYMNMGFSGNAKGEIIFAQYLSKIANMSLFVYDYDHNAPNVEHLQNTHEPFFKVIRNAKPNLPIVILSKPDTDANPADASLRREVIYNTYFNAKASGDNKVWFVDGQQFFGTYGRAECTVDGVHPNNLGFMRMAETLYPIIKNVLTNN